MVLNLSSASCGVKAVGEQAQPGLERDAQAIDQKGDQDMRLYALVGAMEDWPHWQVLLEFLEGLFDVGDLDVEGPQQLGRL